MKRFLLTIVGCLVLLASCSLLPEFRATPPEPQTPGESTTQTLVDAAPEALQAITGLMEMLIWTALIASLLFRPVRLAVSAMLVAFYNRIESWFRPKPGVR